MKAVFLRHIEGVLSLNLILKAISWYSKASAYFYIWVFVFSFNIWEEFDFCLLIMKELVFLHYIPSCMQYIPKAREMCERIYNSNSKQSYLWYRCTGDFGFCEIHSRKNISYKPTHPCFLSTEVLAIYIVWVNK